MKNTAAEIIYDRPSILKAHHLDRVHFFSKFYLRNAHGPKDGLSVGGPIIYIFCSCILHSNLILSYLTKRTSVCACAFSNFITFEGGLAFMHHTLL